LHALHLHALTGREQVRQVDSEREALAREPPTSPGVRVQPDGMCYIIFTSGSTGRPKGAVLQHAGVVNYLHCITACARCLPPQCYCRKFQAQPLTRVGHARRKMDLGPRDVFLQKAPVSFDASVQELFNPFACGGVLLLAAPGGEKDTQYLARLCREQRVTCASFVPSQLDVLLQARTLLE